MLFSSLIFIFVFLPAVLFVYYVFMRNRQSKNIFLTLASFFFYAWGEPKFVFVMILSIFLNYLLGLFIASVKSKKGSYAVIAITIVTNLSLLFYYKYFDFFISNTNSLFKLNIPLRNIALPIGISFFTFQAMSYVFDVYRGLGKVQKNPLNVALYIALFPQLIAGPIVRYETIAEQIKDRRESIQMFSDGTKRFLIGLLKKVLLSNPLALVADYAFNTTDYANLSVAFALLGALAYSLQIYYDFSGYSDMAIGLGKIFGFQFLDNFNYPYISKSISEFWRRWHISLGTWFRDYVYFPLGGSRVKTRGRLIFNLFIVWSLTGVWHGANWTFIAWGILYFIFISFEKITGIPQKLKHSSSKILYQILTLFIVLFGWILFRSNDINSAGNYFQALFHLKNNAWFDQSALLYLRENIFIFIPAIFFATPIAPLLGQKLFNAESSKLKQIIVNLLYYSSVLLLFLIVVSYLVKGSYNPFIYFNF